MLWFYNVLWLLALPGIAYYLVLRRLLSGKYRDNLGPRLGFGVGDQVQPSNRKVIWVHALSVGEVLSAVPLVYSVREQLPQYEIVFSTTTEAGQQIARRKLSSLDCRCLYLPLDYYWAIRRTVRAVGADLFVLVETDFWPNLFWCLEQQSTPTVLVNGRLSDRSFERYRRLKSFFGQAFRRIHLLCMQSDEDAQRMVKLGIDAERIRVTGNLKFDQPLHQAAAEEREELIRELGWDAVYDTWIAGSTHSGEEEIILRVYAGLRRRFHNLRLILAPRNPERFSEAYGLATQEGWRTALRSQLPTPAGQGLAVDVLILDTIGELARLYSLGDFAFLGGSLVSVGGHNPLEAAQRGLPVVFGPHMENFREIARILEQSGGGFQVANEIELFERIESWLSSPKLRVELGEKAQAALLPHQGAVERNVEVIKDLLVAN